MITVSPCSIRAKWRERWALASAMLIFGMIS